MDQEIKIFRFYLHSFCLTLSFIGLSIYRHFNQCIYFKLIGKGNPLPLSPRSMSSNQVARKGELVAQLVKTFGAFEICETCFRFVEDFIQ